MVVKSGFSTPKDGRKSFIVQVLPQVLAVCVKNILLLAYGMTLGYPTILIPSLSGNKDDMFSLGPDAISWIGSINFICVPFGCILSGVATQPFGRKRSMQFLNIPFVAAWLMFAFSDSVWQIFVALGITGLFGGLLEAPVLTYVAEITQPHLRGMLSSTSSMAVILGILCQFLFGTFMHWRTVALVNCSVPILSFFLLFFVPETPHWLIMKNRLADAQKSIAWLRGWTTVESVEAEFKELCRQLGKNSENGIDNPAFEDIPSDTSKETKNIKKLLGLNKLEIFTKKNFFWPYILVSFIFFLGHFSGMTTLQTYAVHIFATLKAPIDKYYATIILGVVELFGTIGCVCSIHYVGKRVLAFISLTGCGICYLIVATYSYCIDVQYLDTGSNNNTTVINATINSSSETPSYIWIPTTFLIASAFTAHLCIRILPWILIGEVYTNQARATASGLSGGMGYIFGFFANKTFLSMISVLTLPGTFWFYSCVSFIGIITLYFTLPETEGKTLYEITEHFSGNGKLGNKVYRKKKQKCDGDINSAYVNTEENGKYEQHDIESKL